MSYNIKDLFLFINYKKRKNSFQKEKKERPTTTQQQSKNDLLVVDEEEEQVRKISVFKKDLRKLILLKESQREN